MPERRHRRSTLEGLAPLGRLAPIWVAGSLLLVAIGRQQGIPQDQLLLDPASYGGLPWYTGLLSNLGILGWTAATAIAVFGARLSRLGQRAGAGYLLGGGALLSALLTLDDLFQLHIVAADMFGLSKRSIYLGYCGLLGLWVAANRSEMSRTPLPLLVAAAGALGTSAVIDHHGSRSVDWLVAEDACKFLGILAWAAYFWETAWGVGQTLVTPAPFGSEVDGALSNEPGSEPEGPRNGSDGPGRMSQQALSAGRGQR